MFQVGDLQVAPTVLSGEMSHPNSAWSHFGRNEILANLVVEFGKVHWSVSVMGIDLNEKPVLRFNTYIVHFIIK